MTDTSDRAGAAVSLEERDRVAVVTLDRPEQGNAMNHAMARELVKALKAVASASGVRALVLTGRGPTFCVGGDVADFVAAGPDRLPALVGELIDLYHPAVEVLSNLEVPVIAAVRGAAAGVGLALVCSADIVVAGADAVFTVAYPGIGLSCDGGLSWSLPRLVGPRRAAEMFLTGERLDAPAALDAGIVTRVVPPDELDAESTALADRLASGPTRAYAAIRRLTAQSLMTPLTDQLHAERASMIAAATTRDAHEGIDAFKGRRRPSFEGC